MMNIVLVEPEIPQNTGNIARTCAATGSMLHLIRPLGFQLDDKYMKRAGLDYWFLMKYRVYDSLDDFFAQHPDARCFFATTKAPRSYAQAQYRDGDFLWKSATTTACASRCGPRRVRSTLPTRSPCCSMRRSGSRTFRACPPKDT